jgi:hypothetical protein
LIQLKLITGDRAGTEYLVRQLPLTIGRAPSNALRLQESGVWDRHLEIRLNEEDSFELQVLSEAQATVNDHAIEGSAILSNGDCIAGCPAEIRAGSKLGDGAGSSGEPLLMTEMSYPREHHGHIPFISSFDYFIVSHGTTGLNGRGGSCFGRRNQSVGEWKKGIAADHAALQVELGLSGFPYRNLA